MDVPPSILAQLGLKVQHALRAFTANDRKTIKQTADNYPESKFYKTEDLITQLGIGEALITSLNEKGIPTPLVHTMLCPPRSRMDILTTAEINTLVQNSRILTKYNEVVNRESAYEILTQKLTQKAAEVAAETTENTNDSNKKEEKGMLETIADNSVVKSMMRTAGNQLVRSLLGSLGLSGTTRKKKSSWF